MSERFFLYDHTNTTKSRFVSFMGEHTRYDLVFTYSDEYYGKVLVLHIQSNRFAILGEDDLNEEGYIEFAFGLSEEEAEELTSFLYEVVI